MTQEIKTISAAVPEKVEDFSLYNSGTLFLLRPKTDAARAWLAEHCPSDNEHIYFCGSLVIEPRYLDNLLNNLCNDGLTV